MRRKSRLSCSELELNAAKNAPVLPVSSVQTADASAGAESPGTTFDVSKHISLVPQFRETEVDSYFSVFERIASALNWSKEVWPLLLQRRLTGKAQDVCTSLSLEDSLNYDMVKTAILRTYELVPEAYRQRFRNHKKILVRRLLNLLERKESCLTNGAYRVRLQILRHYENSFF